VADSARKLFPRGTDEFTRVLAFSDAVFAIAMTLLVVGIAQPVLEDPESGSELLDRLGEQESEFISFFISFAVIGRYWAAHHRFFGILRAMDGPLIALNLVYLAFIAFLPYPTDVLGNFFENPVAVATYAVAVAIVSGLEVVLFRRAYSAHLLEREMPAAIYRWVVLSSTLPVLMFLLSVPIAFVSSVLAVVCWFLTYPAELLLDARKPVDADAYL
jgi:uncharacterized membrane protein